VETLTGNFWIEGGNEVAGYAEIQESGGYTLHLRGFCFVPEQADFTTDGAIGFSADPAKVAADYAPRTLFGKLEDGSLVSFLGAHMEPGPVFSVQILQRFSGQKYVVGAHVKDETEDVRGLRWTWHLPNTDVRWAPEIGGVPVSGELSGTVSPWEAGRDAGLNFASASGVPLHKLLMDVLSSCTQLLGIWTGRRPPKVNDIEFRLPDGTWCSYFRPHEGERLLRSRLLPLTDLSLEKVAAWIPLAARINPFPYIVNAPTDVLQVDAQVLATALEGLHRRLYAGDRPFSSLSKRSVGRAMDEARKAGVAALRKEGLPDYDLADRLLRGNLNHVDQPTYQDRLMQLASPVWALAPGLCGPSTVKWAEMIKKVRNDQSHQLLDSFSEPEIAVYYTATLTCRWVLILRILMEFVSIDSLKTALAESDVFLYALANVDGERLWGEFSALATFRTSMQSPNNAYTRSESAPEAP
jgi:ApeA N-terminal domain 1